METIEVIRTEAYVCPTCKKQYDTLEDAQTCQRYGEAIKLTYEELKDKHGHVLKFPRKDGCHYVLINKVTTTSYDGWKHCSALFNVWAMDSNDYYTYKNWFADKNWVLMTMEEAVLDGWRPLSISCFQGRKDNNWAEYVAAMRKVPYETLFEEAINCITKRSSVGD